MTDPTDHDERHDPDEDTDPGDAVPPKERWDEHGEPSEPPD